MSTQKIKNANPYNNGSAVLQPARLSNNNVKSLSSQFPTTTIKLPSAYEYAEPNVKFASFTTTSASPVVLAAITGKRIRVLSYVLITDAQQTVKWQSDTNDISGAMSLDVSSGISAHNPQGLLQTNNGEALRLLPSSSGNVSGHISYVVY